MPTGEATGGVEALLSHLGWARRLARSLLADRADADDLVQEALIVGVQRPPAERGATRGWFATVLRNLAVNRAVAERRRRVREQGLEVGVAASPEDALVVVQTHRLLARLLEELPEDQRRLLVLRYFEEHSSAEIGAMLEMPPATVRWRLSIALDELRSRLDDAHGGDRRRWRLALLPLASRTSRSIGKGTGAGLATARTLALPSVLTLAALGAGSVLVATMGRKADPTAGPIAAAALLPRASTYAAPSSIPATRHPGSAASGEPGAATCGTRLEQAARELEMINQDLRRFESGGDFWDAAKASDQAQAAVAPLMVDFLTERAATLECREWICRITFVLRPDVDWTAERAAALEGSWRHRAGTLVDRAEFDKLGGITRDPLSGELQQAVALYLRLQRSFGEAPSSGRTANLAAATCAQDVAALRAQADRLRPRRDRALPLAERFRRTAALDRRATVDVQRAIDKALGDLVGAVNIECREGLCRADLVGSADAGLSTWSEVEARLRRDAGWSARFPVMWAGAGQEQYLKLNHAPREISPEQARREAIHKELNTKIFAVVRACVAENPGTPHVNGRVLVPGPGELNEDGRDDRPSFRLSGPGVDGPLGKCVLPRLGRILAGIELPVPLSRWEMNFSFNGQRP